MSSIVIVESPSKAKTIRKYLGASCEVLASYGHVRDIPSKKDCVLPEKNFQMIWYSDNTAQKHLQDIENATKKAKKLILATDPDREGEAIAWHVYNILKDKRALDNVIVERVSFNAVTKEAVLEAMKNPRALDENLIQAYLARRALDYLVGFTLSPILWRKLPGARSAGRVQSVALRLVCERHNAIEIFKSQEYWSILGSFIQDGQKDKSAIEAQLSEVDGKKLEKMSLAHQSDVDKLVTRAKKAHFSILSIETKPAKRHPTPPFITSTLQQEAARKYGFSARKTMRLAQELYEGVDIGEDELMGLITYMRTDSVAIIPAAIDEIRSAILEHFGPTFLPKQPRLYKTKAKNAQEAHEAIRPTMIGLTPNKIARRLESDTLKLYTLIWNRTMASQMESAQFDRTMVLIATEAKDLIFKATGSIMIFPGFLKLYAEDFDEKNGHDDDVDHILPALTHGARAVCQEIEGHQHFTEPPPQYTEASLVKKMEELEIGRPSTYASTLTVLKDRGYAEIEKNHRFTPTGKGLLVTAFLEGFFSQYVEYAFTADLEEKLDHIAAGDVAWLDVLKQFWKEFKKTAESVTDLQTRDVLEKLTDDMQAILFPNQEDGQDPRLCPTCKKGRLSVKTGRFGAFIGCPNYPDCAYTRPLFAEEGEQEQTQKQGEYLGKDPQTGADIFFKTGRFGPYFEKMPVSSENNEITEQAPKKTKGKGKKREKKEAPKRVGIPKAWQEGKPDLAMALQLFQLPRFVGLHPETGKEILANNGRFGPYVVHDGIFAQLGNFEEIFTITSSEAVERLILKKQAQALKKTKKSDPKKNKTKNESDAR